MSEVWCARNSEGGLITHSVKLKNGKTACVITLFESKQAAFSVHNAAYVEKWMGENKSLWKGALK